MPELPEVETTIKGLSQKVLFKKIKGCWTDQSSRVFIRSDFPRRNPGEIIKGKTIESIERKGKNIIINLSKGIAVLVHQKISGHLLLGEWKEKSGKWIPSDKLLAEKINSFIHFIIFLSDGPMIAVSDPRKFFKIEFWKKKELMDSEAIKKIGPDALDIGLEKFRVSLRGRKREIKKLLIDQSFIAGIGNIYSDEILWDAQINPSREASSLDKNEVETLFKSMAKILKKAVRLKGDSISDYRLVTGEKGGYQNFHKVYQREGRPCKRKDGGIIKKRKFGGRHLRYCPVCQK